MFAFTLTSIRVNPRRCKCEVTSYYLTLVQFVALCYYEYFSSIIRELKAVLGVKNGDYSHDLKQNLNKEAQYFGLVQVAALVILNLLSLLHRQMVPRDGQELFGILLHRAEKTGIIRKDGIKCLV